MAALRRITSTALQQLKSLLADNSVLVKPIAVKYKDYVARNKTQDAKKPLQFHWSRGKEVEPLFFGFYTWSTAEGKKHPDTFLALGTNATFRIVGFPLYLLPQDKEFVYLSFKLGNNEGGKNRWFGRERSTKELRSVDQTDQLAIDMRTVLHKAFPGALFSHPTLAGEWLTIARLPLADLKSEADPAQRIGLKTLILEKLLQAFVIAEKLRDDSLKAAGMQANETDIEDDFSNPPTMSTPLNQILYGPPGTGKTYHTSTRAVGILEGLEDHEVTAKYTRQETRARFEEYQQAGWIGFVTFHQAFSYEDFVEGIKPDVTEETEELRYSIEPGIFRTLADKALAAWQQAQQPAAEIPLPFELVYDAYLADLQTRIDAGKGQATLHTVEDYKVFVTHIDTKNTVFIAHAKAEKPTPISLKWTRAVYSQFAQASDIVPMNKTMRKIGGPNASLQWAVFNDLKNFEAQHQAELQAATTEEPPLIDTTEAPRFVLIIDEINRGNVANIFGELITLLEDDKRAGRPEALTVKLPYSKEDFTVPENLYLLGTMNTADRSVEALDTALRRRFSFTEMRPEAGVIRAQPNQGIIGEGAEAVDVARLLEVLNSRLEQLLDHDHCLGHALLLRLTDLAGLRAAFARNILPLLQEYFFGDWGKIGLVLGERFITETAAGERHALAKFGKYDAGGSLRDKPLYRLTPPETWDAAAFRSIYPAAPVMPAV